MVRCGVLAGVLLIAFSGAGPAWTSGAPPSARLLLVRPTELVGFEAQGTAAVYTSVAAWVKAVDAGDPATARHDTTALPGEGFMSGASQQQRGTGTDSHGAGFSAGLVFRTSAGATADVAHTLSGSLAATRAEGSETIVRFTVSGVPRAEGFTAIKRGQHAMAGNVYFATGRCEVNIGEEANPSGNLSQALLQQTVQESVTSAAARVYTRVHRSCA